MTSRRNRRSKQTATTSAIVTLAEILEPKQLLSGQSLIARPNLTGPVDSADETPIITWNAIDEASRVELWVNRLPQNGDSGAAKVIHETAIAGNATSFQVGSDLSSQIALPSGRYRAWIRGANDADGMKSVWSAPHTFSIGQSAPVVPVLNLLPATTTDRTPTFTWSADAANDGYEIYISRNGAAGAYVRTKVGQAAFTSNEDMAEGTYRIWVRGQNSAGQSSGWSKPGLISVGEEPLTVNVKADDNAVALTWRNGEFVKYDVWVSTKGVKGATLRKTVATEEIVISSEVSPGTYKGWVRGQRSDGSWSAWSAPLEFTIPKTSVTERSPTPSAHTSLAVRDGNWRFFDSNEEAAAEYDVKWGNTASDHFLQADWDGTGSSMVLVRQHASGLLVWYTDTNLDAVPEWNMLFGLPGDIPVVGDWDGDGKDNAGVVRKEADGLLHWYLDTNGDPAAEQHRIFGLHDDTPIAGNFDASLAGDEVGIVRPNGAFLDWYIDRGTTESHTVPSLYGFSTDTPVVGDWDGDGTDNMGVFRNDGGQLINWLFDTNGDPAAEREIRFGLPSHIPIPGNWKLPSVEISSENTPIADEVAGQPLANLTFPKTSTANPITTKVITISNPGNAALQLQKVSFSNTAFSVIGTVPQSVAAGESVTITIQADATATPKHRIESTITISTNAVAKAKQEYRFSLVTDNPVRPIPQINLEGVKAGTETSLGSKLQDDDAISRVFTIKNTGVGELIVNKIGVADNRFIISDLSRKNIPAGQSATFRVSFPSNALGVYTSNLNINSDATNLPNYTIRLRATVLQRLPEITIPEVKDNGSIDLGVVKKGAPELRHEFTIQNTGTANLELKAPTISSSAFKVTDVGKRVLKPGEHTTFHVTLSTEREFGFIGTVNISSNDATNRNYSFDVKATVSSTSPKLTIDGWQVNQRIDMGTTYLGERALTRTFTIRNHGDATLNVKNVTVSNSQITVSQPLSSSVASDKTTTFTITIDPDKVKQLKTVSGSVRVFSNGGSLSFTVLGKVDGKATATVDGIADNGTFNFGSTTKGGSTITKTFTIRNKGTKTLRVKGIKASSSEFTVQSVATLINRGQTKTFTVTMKAGAIGSPTGRITIETDDPTNSAYVINVRGTVITDVHSTHYVSMERAGSVTDPSTRRNVGFRPEDVLKIEEFDNGSVRISMYFDGTRHGLSNAGENIDALTFSGGKMIISTAGQSFVPGVNAEYNDLLAFDPNTKRWSMVFDGSSHHLYRVPEANVDAVSAHNGGFVMSIGKSHIDDLLTEPEDLVFFKNGKWSKFLDGRDSHIFSGNVDAAAIIPGGVSVSLDVGLGLGTSGYAHKASTIELTGNPARPTKIGFDSIPLGISSYDVDAYHVDFRPAVRSFGDRAATTRESAKNSLSVILDDERDELFADLAVFGL